ncbi:hypothetical protein P3342_006720 [Pyrenophora teres f. teres]|uniref:Uncharacterized protein n=2 Tax=Pyrenophora teres f. teres TaxID=97479 RepID=E3S8W7_PYRTT|nr:hypothetical protein PTT_19452 [Pyrenophora teres f. teres 0-1]KAE8833456.1 hypothetical protein HRS9139_05275 [Pyrenophora teres f. teres]KAE8840775.1 hypothetical protein PTNB85_04174 [Pyrenophora teres f. teres]KAE8849086.1 hypothetical protein HRS9122_03102 [Pyrenophora teres f. teres]KAE8864271.1 hypothetical protein PTNB29_04235 [Pyrenophora teres f. teres]
MSTFTPSESGRLPISIAVVQEQIEQPPHQATYIPPSASVDDSLAEPSDTFDSNCSLLDMRGYSNVNIDIPLNTPSSLYMEVTHDGKVTELVARFESYASYSDAAEASHDGHISAPSPYDHPAASSHAETVREGVLEQTDHHFSKHTGVQPGPGHSPRKAIPSHWFPKSTGPNLATAQRAKERTHKKSAEGSSPGEASTIRGTHSSFDLIRGYGKEGATYLTKEALATVDSTITSSSAPFGTSIVPGSPSKKAWNSPTRSPVRSSTSQQPKLSFKMSPAKLANLNTESSPGHSRATSSISTSTGNTAFYTAQGSPVRSPTGTEQSFHTALEYPEEPDVSGLGSNADSDDHQVSHDFISSPSAIKETGEDTTSPIKLKRAHDPSPKSGPSPLHPVSCQQASRIPRIGATSKIAIPTRNSTLKRAESVASLKYKLKMMQIMHAEADEASSPQNSMAASPGHSRTIESSNIAYIAGKDREEGRELLHNEKSDSHLVSTTIPEQPHVATQHIDTPKIEPARDQLGQHAITSEIPRLDELPHITAPLVRQASTYSSRTASTSTVCATSRVVDPVPTDSAIIYSRKKTDILGTTLTLPNKMPPIIVMMAHSPNIGNLSPVTDEENAASAKPEQIHGHNAGTSPARGRSERYVPGSRKQRDSDRSTHSSMGSDLRATAAEFVPQPASSVVPKEPFTAPEFVPRPSSTTATVGPSTATVAGTQYHDIPGLPDMTVLDRNGIPFLWYMYGVQFAYEQGFRNGRPKSPKKIKPKKQRSTLSSPSDATNPVSNSISVTASSSVTPIATERKRRLTSAELMPPPPVPVHRRQEDDNSENSHPSLQKQDAKAEEVEMSQSFSNQFDTIDRTVLVNRTNINASRPLKPFLPSGPRSMQLPTYHTVPRRGNRYRHPGNGLYGGRGNAAGIPIDATAPFPTPVAPQGRVSQAQVEGGISTDYSGYTIGREACGMIQIDEAMEKVGGLTCHACDPGH